MVRLVAWSGWPGQTWHRGMAGATRNVTQNGLVLSVRFPHPRNARNYRLFPLSKVHIARSNIAASSHAKIEAFPYVPLSCVALLFLENNSKTLSAAIVHSCNIFWLKMTGSRFSKPLGGRKEKRKRERHVVSAGFIRRRTKRRPRKSVRAQFWSVPLFCQWRTRDNNVWLLFGQLQQLNACIVNSEKGKKKKQETNRNKKEQNSNVERDLIKG